MDAGKIFRQRTLPPSRQNFTFYLFWTPCFALLGVICLHFWTPLCLLVCAQGQFCNLWIIRLPLSCNGLYQIQWIIIFRLVWHILAPSIHHPSNLDLSPTVKSNNFCILCWFTSIISILQLRQSEFEMNAFDFSHHKSFWVVTIIRYPGFNPGPPTYYVLRGSFVNKIK